MEIIEFYLGDKICGVEVLQVREVIRVPDGIVPVPGPHPSLSGVVNLRGRIIPVVDLPRLFSISSQGNSPKNRVIIADFNYSRVGFRVDYVTGIKEISKLIVESPAQPLEPWANFLQGVIQEEIRRVFLLNFEKIALVISPEISAPSQRARPKVSTSLPIPQPDFDRSTKNLLVVEDSSFMRQLLARYLKAAGYNILAAANGLEAWEILKSLVQAPDFKDITQHYHLILSDIEMPVMDGLELIRNVKGHPLLKKLPCVVFSGSLIEDLPEKCRAVGADAQIDKADIDKLVRLLDSKVLLS